MNVQGKRMRPGRALPITLLAVLAISCAAAERVRAAQRTFIVMLANSPKEFPNPARAQPGQPFGGLPSSAGIEDRYFDTLRDDIGSFAEYWDEISYGDVTISGQVTQWINLPWAVLPPLVDPTDDDPILGAPANAPRISPTNLQYGAGETVQNFFAAVAVDTNGDQGAGEIDDGPFATAGSNESTPRGVPIFRPGERFVDLDGDRRWDGLDETLNWMDWNEDGRPDGLGPWLDLNENGEADADTRCVFLPDSDNDGNPDCCPEGPEPYDPNADPEDQQCFGWPENGACPATRWDEGTENIPIEDCNGNLIHDACDIDCHSQECIDSGHRRFCDPAFPGFSNPPPAPRSMDRLPFSASDTQCLPDDGNGSPDECEYLNFDIEEGCVEATPDEPDACVQAGVTEVCRPIPLILSRTTAQRCEFDDTNENGALDVVEPFENFLRRWDPCMFDPDVSGENALATVTHWIKVYDPSSSSVLSCGSPSGSLAYDASTQPEFICPVYAPDCDPDSAGDTFRIENPLHRPGDRHTRSYIEDNYPGNVHRLEQLAGARQLWGDHDPFRKISGICICADGVTPCRPISFAQDDFIERACPAGTHAQFDPPDRWVNTLSSTKMQAAPGRGGSAAFLVQSTPEEPWYEQAWTDRYVGGPSHPLADEPLVEPAFSGCENPDFDPEQAGGPSNEPLVDCEAPAWPAFGLTLAVAPFEDDNPLIFDPDTDRRFFRANRGGLNGNGTGWPECGAGTRFETGNVTDFVVDCDAPILPDEINGTQQPPVFYDGRVEHDDLPSSKYHKEGDQRLGEVTSPFSSAIWGEDRGQHDPSKPPTRDGIIPAAGPYATHIHGNFGRDAGNQLTIELLTWRQKPPFNNGTVWESQHGVHPYAGPSGMHMGFRDYNLDGLIDQGEVRPAGSENYTTDSVSGTSNDGTFSDYPFNRQRLLEDCVEVLDFSNDFDDFVDEGAMAAATSSPGNGCSGPALSSSNNAAIAPFPIEFVTDTDSQGRPFGSATAAGIASGIVLLPPTAGAGLTLFPRAPGFYPIHTEDGLNDPDYVSENLPRTGTAQLSWHLFFHDLVKIMLSDANAQPIGSFETGYAAHEYLHSWEGFEDLYDYDVRASGAGIDVNCPIADWDIMANGGLVHPNPSLKETPCTEWLSPVDLKTVLTPGVESVLTLPPFEFVRDNSAYYLENENRPGERLWLWSAGRGFDEPGHPGSGGFPGGGVLIMHTDFEANEEGIPPQQNTEPFRYVIVQADGLRELEEGDTFVGQVSVIGEGSCQNVADDGDPWPGSAGTRAFNCDTVPASQWNTENSCSGLAMSNVVLDGSGGALVTLRWTPTSIPSLEFVDPPGGVSVPVSPTNVRYRIRYKATDVYGGTTITLYYTANADPVAALKNNTAVQIGVPIKKIQPGTVQLTQDWNIVSVSDGRYFLFARLTPGMGADGTEIAFTTPRAGRNNVGQGTLTVNGVGSFVRTETWTLEMVDLTQTNQVWRVNGSLTQPRPDDDSTISANERFNVPRSTGVGQFTSAGGEVTFTLRNLGTSFAIGDRWSFVTTGITAASKSVTIDEGRIREGPTAVIFASPVSGNPPLTVSFDGRSSFDSNSGTLEYRWSFGDGSPAATGATVVHTFSQPRTFTVVLRVTNLSTGLFDETSVDIEVTNNSPSARLTATPTSGPAPLNVRFDAGQSSDPESTLAELIFQWDFGDGTTDNAAGLAGVSIQAEKLYTRRISGSLSNGTPCTVQSPCTCTSAEPCSFTAKLTVTDSGGKSDVDTVDIQVGNSKPIANITHTALQGPAPWTVTFNAINSTDPDGDTIKVDWVWDDGKSDLNLPLTGPGNHTDGQVEHTYQNTGQYQPVVTLKDGRGGVTVWSAVTVVVSDAGVGASDPRAIFVIDPEVPLLNQPFTVDATLSFDRPSGLPSSYTWRWGDGTPNGSGVTATHTYTRPGTYSITLTVADDEDPPNTNSTSKTVVVTGDEQPPEPPVQNRPPTARFIVSGGPEIPNEGIVGETVFTFDASSSSDPDGDDLAFDWSFGDGTFQTNAPAVVTRSYARAETFVVRLTVRDESNLAMNATQSVIVRGLESNAVPVAVVTQGRRSGSAPLTLTFDASLSYDTDGDALTFTWDFGDGSEPSTGMTVTHTFNEEGTYTVVLDVSDGVAVGSADPETVDVTASVAPPEPEPPEPEPTTPSSGGRGGICGLGGILGFAGSLLGLTAMRISRRRLA